MKIYQFILIFAIVAALNGCSTTEQQVKKAVTPRPVDTQTAEFSPWGDVTQTAKGLKIVVEGDSLFKLGRSKLSQNGIQIIDGISKVLANHPSDLVTILDYTDNGGSSTKNLVLSERRAQAIKNEMVKQSVPVDYVSATGEGDADPVSTNDTPVNRAKNRRVEFEINMN